MVIRTLQPGTGESPKATDTVKVHYHGTLTDGTVFDSSVQRGQPATFPLNGVIPCWTEGVQKMKVGEKAKLTCPSAIAYGDRGRPPTIPGGATLVFEISLISIEPPAPTGGPGMPGMPPGMPGGLQGMQGMPGGMPPGMRGGPGGPGGIHINMPPPGAHPPGAPPSTPPKPSK